jgi:hypothetical protein
MAFPDTLFGYPIVESSDNPVSGDIVLGEPWKHYVQFSYTKDGHKFNFTVAELESLIEQAKELLKKD